MTTIGHAIDRARERVERLRDAVCMCESHALNARTLLKEAEAELDKLAAVVRDGVG